MYWGAEQMPSVLAMRRAVTSGGPSSASGARLPRTPAAPAAEMPVRKARRDFGMICMEASVVQFRANASAAAKVLTPSARA